jgi:non-ribosomal peptide synthetase component F
LNYEKYPTTLQTNVKYDGEAAAYLVFTSGTTGEPKGVIVLHKGLANIVYKNPFNPFSEVLQALEEPSTISTAKVSFDAFILEISNMYVGCSIYIADGFEMMDPNELAAVMKLHKVNYVFLTPSKFLAYSKSDKYRTSAKDLKLLMMGAEALTDSIVKQIETISPQIRLFNLYGPSEATIYVTSSEIVRGSAITIGKPITNTKCLVVNQTNRQLLPLYCPGEILIQGIQVGDGYVNNKTQTEKVLVTFNGQKTYCSGDFAR